MFRPIQLPEDQQPEQGARFTPIPINENVEIDAVVLRLPHTTELVAAIRNLLSKYDYAATSIRLPLMCLRKSLTAHHLAYIEAIPELEKMKAKIKARLELSEHLTRSISTLTVAAGGDALVEEIPFAESISSPTAGNNATGEEEEEELRNINANTEDYSGAAAVELERGSVSITPILPYICSTSTSYDPRIAAVLSRSSTQSPTIDERVVFIPLFDEVIVCLYFMMTRLELFKHDYLFGQNSSFVSDLNILRNLLQIEDMQEFTTDVNAVVKLLAKYEAQALARNAQAQYSRTNREIAWELRAKSRTPQAQEQSALTWLFGAQQRSETPNPAPRKVTFDDKEPTNDQSTKCLLM